MRINRGPPVLLAAIERNDDGVTSERAKQA
jgi:hypothetical protein